MRPSFSFARLIEKTPTGVIEIHIPSDADLDQPQRLAAYAQARQFWGPAYTDYECFSWLLSPVLKQILPAKSHILQFQSDFRIERWDKEQGDYRKWIFHNSQAPIADLPETTSLQRSVKQLLLDGSSRASIVPSLARAVIRKFLPSRCTV